MTVTAPRLDAKTATEISQTFVEQGIITSSSKEGGGLQSNNYEEWKMDRDAALVYRLLDSLSADGGLSEKEKKEMVGFLKGNENAYNVLSDCIVSPIRSDDEEVDAMVPIKRSYRATKILEQDATTAAKVQQSGGTLQDIEDSDTLILNGTRAGLLAKKLFRAYMYNQNKTDDNEDAGASLEVQTLPPHIPHVNHLLMSLLEGYASAVVAAACAGGKEGIESSFGPMLAYRSGTATSTSTPTPSTTNEGSSAAHDDAGSTASLESPLPVLAAIVTTGCTGRLAPGAAAEQRAANPMMMQQQQLLQNDNTVHISKGHRRKFVRSLADWELLTRLADCIDHPGTDESAMYRSEAACDALLNIVDNIGFPPMPPPGVALDAKKKKEMEESFGEDQLLAPLATDEFIHHLTNCVTGGSLNNSTSASRALLGLFDLATGRSKNHSAPPALDAADTDEVAAKAAQAVDESSVEVVNKIKKSGLTSLMQKRLVANIDLLVRGMDVYGIADGEAADTRKEDRGDGDTDGSVIRHPGHYVIKRPFTSRRLHLISLLADILDFDCDGNSDDKMSDDENKGGDGFTSAREAIDVINDFPLPPSMGGDDIGEDVSYNPFPGLVDLLFAYPENNLYQIQFYRLLHSLCMTNHEGALKIVVQKTKFVGRAIKAIKNDPTASNKGVLLRCLNALRLLSQSLSSHSFLRHYLDSHDGWKAFQDTLRKITMEQQRPGGGIPMPQAGPTPGMLNSGVSGLVEAINSNPLIAGEGGGEKEEGEIDIDLGSEYAADIGFGALSPFTGDEEDAPAGNEITSSGKEEGGGSSAKKKKKSKKKKKR